MDVLFPLEVDMKLLKIKNNGNHITNSVGILKRNIVFLMIILDIKKKWRQLVRENHPDVLTAKGLPSEAIVLANKKVIAHGPPKELLKNEKAKSLYFGDAFNI